VILLVGNAKGLLSSIAGANDTARSVIALPITRIDVVRIRLVLTVNGPRTLLVLQLQLHAKPYAALGAKEIETMLCFSVTLILNYRRALGV